MHEVIFLPYDSIVTNTVLSVFSSHHGYSWNVQLHRSENYEVGESEQRETTWKYKGYVVCLLALITVNFML